MTPPAPHRPAFLQALTPSSVFRASALNHPVAGQKAISRIVETVGGLYVSQVEQFSGRIGDKQFLQYEAVLTTGESLVALVAITFDDAGAVAEVNVSHSPLASVLALSRLLGRALGEDLGADLFA